MSSLGQTPRPLDACEYASEGGYDWIHGVRRTRCPWGRCGRPKVGCSAEKRSPPLEPLRAAHVPFSAPSSGLEEWLIRRRRLASLLATSKRFYEISHEVRQRYIELPLPRRCLDRFFLQVLPSQHLPLVTGGGPRPRTQTVRGCHMSSASKPYLYA